MYANCALSSSRSCCSRWLLLTELCLHQVDFRIYHDLRRQKRTLGGSLLLAGRSGYGRRSSIGVIANMHGMTVHTPRVNRDYGLKQFRNDLKTVCL